MSRFVVQLGKSRFFVISVALHFLLVITGGTAVLFRQINQPHNETEATGDLIAAQAAPPTEPVPEVQQQPNPEVSDASSKTPMASSLSPITTTAPSSFTLPSNDSLDTNLLSKTFASQTNQTGVAPATAPRPNEIPRELAKQMKTFTDWNGKKGEIGQSIKSRSFKFTAYLAKYADGDWDSTIRMDKGKIEKGSLPNLLYLMRKLSRDKIDADPDAIPLELSSDEIFVKRPPFILFTGHRDFKLSDKEVENLRKYLQLGGCVWGDASLPGNRSRFDIAFRREMKRILPDQDINWEALPLTHPLYARDKIYYPEIKEPPSGVNYYQEPVYVLKNYGEISVIYTANDYCDMWQLSLTEQLEFDLRQDERGNYVALNNEIFRRRDTFFRGMELKQVIDSYKFGTNVVLHLLTRWEDKLRNVGGL